MRPIQSLAVLAALSTLAACASAPRASDGSAYGLYLAARGADAVGDSDASGQFYAAAKAAGAEADDLDQQIFLSALDRGDILAAAKLAPPKPTPDPEGDSDTDAANQSVYQLGVLTRMVALMIQGDGKGALALDQAEPVTMLRTEVAQLEPWIQLMAGQSVDSLNLTSNSGRPLGAASLMSHARLSQAAGKPDLAEADYKALEAAGLLGATVIEHGAMLERLGRGDEAKTLYASALATAPGRLDLQAAVARVGAHGKPPALPSFKAGAAQVLFGQAAQMGQVGVSGLQLAFLRMGLGLEPTNYQAWLDLGDTLEDQGDYERALAAYRKTPASAPEGTAAAARIASLYQDSGESQKALQAGASAFASAPRDTVTGVVYAEILAQNDRYAEAIKVYDGLIAQASPPDWRLYYQRWRSLALSGNDAAGEDDLQAALKLAPNEASLLNALGYSWIDRSENLDQAMDMVRRAAATQPNNGEIIDSLGWGYFHLGDFTNAVTQLETAVQLEPAEAEINDHLGDAYWRAGRQVEARFQWERALTLDPDAVLKAKVQAKLQSGLPPTAAGRPAASAAAAPTGS